MTLHQPPLFVLTETPALRARIEALHDLHAGVVVCRMSSGHRRIEQLANDLMTALGKDLSRASGARNQDERWQRATAWLAAYEPRELVVLGADRVGWKAWRDLTELAAFVGARLWLVMSHETQRREEKEFLTKWRAWRVVGDEREFAALMGTPAVATAPERTRSFPRVPQASFLLFRALAYESLAKREFELVDAAWGDALASTRAWIGEQDVAEEEAVAAFLRALIAPCASRDELVTRLRGAQVAFFLADCLLLINERQLDARAEQAPSPISDEDVLILCKQQSARDASLALLGVLSGAGGTALAEVALSDVAYDGTAAVVAGRSLQVPPAAAVVLRAHRLWLLMAGAHEADERFFATSPGHRPSARGTQNVLSALTGQTGLRLAGRHTRHAPESDKRWAGRYGISVQLLHQEARNPEGTGGLR